MTTIGIPPRSQDDWDRPADDVAADMQARAARQQCQVLADAMATHEHDSERIAYAEAIQLLLHPEAPVSTDADYPNWTPGGTK